MFSFFKSKTPAGDVAEGFFDSVRKRAAQGLKARLQFDDASLDSEIVEEEWIYFDVFIFDYATFRVYGNTAARNAVLNPFLSLVASWLKTRQAPATPDRIGPFPDGLSTFNPENAEDSYERLKRRMALYAKAVSAKSAFDGIDNVAMTFCALCGSSSIADVGALSAYFTRMIVEKGKILESYRIK